MTLPSTWNPPCVLSIARSIAQSKKYAHFYKDQIEETTT